MSREKKGQRQAVPSVELDKTLVTPTDVPDGMKAWQHLVVGIPMYAIVPGMLAFFYSVNSLDPIDWGIAACVTAFMTVGKAGYMNAWYSDLKIRGIEALLNKNNIKVSSQDLRDAIWDLKKNDRALLKTFHINEAVDIEIKSLKANQGILPEQATHEVRQYLSLRDKEFVIEQEVIPNEETIWDLSANALVEVYKVKEPKSIET